MAKERSEYRGCHGDELHDASDDDVADSGSTFKVAVTNHGGDSTSSAATLTVNPAAVAPTITTQPANQTVTAGQTATFAVVAAGTAPLSYQWQKNAVNITGPRRRVTRRR